MEIIKIILLGYGLSCDAAAISIVASMQNKSYKVSLMCAVMFSLFQGIMPLLGYYVTGLLGSFLNSINHYVAFILLSMIGINMIKNRNNEENIDNYSFFTIFILGIATSIDAFAVGCTLNLIKLPIIVSSIIISITTFIICFIATLIGKRLGIKYKEYSSIFGGIILLILGIHTLLEHIMI